MPNWCYNSLEVRGKEEDLVRFDNQFKKTHVVINGHESSKLSDEDFVDYSKIARIGFGGEIHFTYSIITSETEEEGYSFSNFIPMTRDEFLEGWYDWCVNNWGTKWDLSEPYVNKDPYASENEQGYYYTFDTAWSPPFPVIEEMAKQYPELTFTHVFEELGMCFYGEDMYTDGMLMESLHLEDDEMYEYFYDTQGREEYYRCEKCGKIQYEEEDFPEPCYKCGHNVLTNPQGYRLEIKDEDEETEIPLF